MDTACRAYLYLFSTYHVVTGIVSMFFPDFAMSFYKTLYGYDPVERTHLRLIFKPWGALAFFAGFVGLFCATDPQRYIGVVIGLAVLHLLRIYYRLAFEKEIATIGRILPGRNRTNVGILFLGFFILSIWLYQAFGDRI